MTDKTRLKIEGFFAIIVWALISLRVWSFITITIRVKLIILLSLNLRMTAAYDSIVHTITCKAEVLLRLIFIIVEVFTPEIVCLDVMLIGIVTIIREDVGLLGEVLVGLGVVGVLI